MHLLLNHALTRADKGAYGWGGWRRHTEGAYGWSKQRGQMEGADGGSGRRGLRERPDRGNKGPDQGTKRRTRGRRTPKTKFVQHHHI